MKDCYNGTLQDQITAKKGYNMSFFNAICPQRNQQSQCEDTQIKCSTRKILGTIALVIGVAMIVMGIIVMTGVFGGGNMYYIAGYLFLGSIIPLSLGLFHTSSKFFPSS